MKRAQSITGGAGAFALHGISATQRRSALESQPPPEVEKANEEAAANDARDPGAKLALHLASRGKGRYSRMSKEKLWALLRKRVKPAPTYEREAEARAIGKNVISLVNAYDEGLRKGNCTPGVIAKAFKTCMRVTSDAMSMNPGAMNELRKTVAHALKIAMADDDFDVVVELCDMLRTDTRIAETWNYYHFHDGVLNDVTSTLVSTTAAHAATKSEVYVRLFSSKLDVRFEEYDRLPAQNAMQKIVERAMSAMSLLRLWKVAQTHDWSAACQARAACQAWKSSCAKAHAVANKDVPAFTFGQSTQDTVEFTFTFGT